MTAEIKTLAAAIEQIAREAGNLIMQIYQRDFSIEEKNDKSPLTEADQKANELIVNQLIELTPEIPILSEEAVEDFAGANAAGEYWLVDPLDGTKEFIKKNGEFTVNIALIRQGKPVLGVVYAPALEDLYLGGEGIGAVKVNAQGLRQLIQVAQKPANKPWRVVGSRSHASQETLDWLKPLGDYELVPMGSSLKLCLVAEGAADVYPRLGPTCLWDTGAAHAVVDAAGGSVKTLEGKILSYPDTAEKLNPYFIVYGGS